MSYFVKKSPLKGLTKYGIQLKVAKYFLSTKANKCRCGSNRIYLEDTLYFYRMTCNSCGNKTSTFSKPEKNKYTIKEFLESTNEVLAAWNRGEAKDWQDNYLYSCATEPLKVKRTPKLMSQEDCNTLLKKKSPMDFYIDFAPHSTIVYDRRIDSIYTPEGIKILDSWYCNRIREFKSKNRRFDFTKRQLKKMITCNRHLHDVIKLNLLLNLENFS